MGKTSLLSILFLSIWFMGFSTNICARDNTNATRNIRLEDYFVTGVRHKTLMSRFPEVVQVIDRQLIEEMNPSSTGEILRYITGTSVETGTGSGLPKRSIIGLNGLPARYTLVLVDGVRLLSEHIHTGRNIEMIPPESIQRIEVLRGAASAHYGGDALGGVVNIITRKAKDTTAVELGFRGGTYDTYRAETGVLTPLDTHSQFSVFVDREQSHGADIIEPKHRLDNMGYEKLSVLSRLDHTLSDSAEVYGWINWDDNMMEWFGDEEDSYLFTSVIGMKNKVSDSFSLATQISRSEWDNDVSDESNELLNPEIYGTWYSMDKHIVTGGFDYKYNDFERSSVEDAPTQERYGAFVQDEWMISERLILMTALRYDDVEDVDSVLSPKISLLYSFDLPLQVRASYTRGFHAPTPQELYERGAGHGGAALRFGNKDLDPEYSNTFGLGFDFWQGHPFEIMIYGHYSEIDDLIVPVYEGTWEKDPTKDVWRRTNIEEAEIYGAEISARYTINRHLAIEGGYTYTENEDTDTGRQLPYDPGSTAYWRTTAKTDLVTNWSVSGHVGLYATFDRSAWSWKPAKGSKPDDASGLSTELDFRAGLNLKYKKRYQIFLNVDNIFGQEIEHLDDVYTVVEGEPTFEAGIKCVW
jgi:outer membrane cobalamin receptor